MTIKTLKNVILSVLTISLLTSTSTSLAATTPSLGTAETYGVLSSSFTRNIGVTTIMGDLGYTTLGGGGSHTATNIFTPSPAQAGIDQGAALVNLNAQVTSGCTDISALLPLDAVIIGANPPGTFPPGCYSSVGAMDLTVGTTMTLSGAGTYIFKPGGALNTAADTNVVLTNGASACDVFWIPVGATTLGAITAPVATTNFIGTIIDDAGITVGLNNNRLGRGLVFGGTFTVATSTITVPTCAAAPGTLHVIKQVSGGVLNVNDFDVHVKLAGLDISNSPFSGTASSGTLLTGLVAGTYTVSDTYTGYTQSFSGDCNGSGVVSLLAGDDKTCTITNTFTPIPTSQTTGTLYVIKTVVGGSAIPSNFSIHVKLLGSGDVPTSPQAGMGGSGTMYILSSGSTYVISEDTSTTYTQSFFIGDCDINGHITLTTGTSICRIINTIIPPVVVSSNNGGGGGGSYYSPIVPLIGITKIPSPLALPNGSGLVIYNYVVWNVGKLQALVDVTVKDDKCTTVTFISGDLNNNSKLDINEYWKYSCTTRLTTTTTNTAIATAYSDDIFHDIAIATAIATVVVGQSSTPPLIHITKVPSRLTPFPYGGGDVKYTYTVTNPGIVSLSDVKVTDNKCAPLSRISGDKNNNKLLDTNEKWIYTCSSNITISTRNIARAQGTANTSIIQAYAFATVLVYLPVEYNSAPLFPNTGVNNEENNNQPYIIISMFILMIASISLIVGFKLHKHE